MELRRLAVGVGIARKGDLACLSLLLLTFLLPRSHSHAGPAGLRLRSRCAGPARAARAHAVQRWSTRSNAATPPCPGAASTLIPSSLSRRARAAFAQHRSVRAVPQISSVSFASLAHATLSQTWRTMPQPSAANGQPEVHTKDNASSQSASQAAELVQCSSGSQCIPVASVGKDGIELRAAQSAFAQSPSACELRRSCTRSRSRAWRALSPSS